MTTHALAHGPRPAQPVAAAGETYLGAVLGVRVFADWSLLLIFGLVLFNVGAGLLPTWHPGWDPALTWATALAAAVLFFASILAHELSHALVARRHGIAISRITLFLFGGLAHMEREPPTPRAELLMAAAGPLASMIIGALATGAGLQLAGPDFLARLDEDAAAALATLGPAASLLLWLGPINLALGIFNCVPGFPLDGGRVLRAVLWWLGGDVVRATRAASRAGRVVAYVMMGFGVLHLLGGMALQGLWLLLIGWFLGNAATTGYQQLVVREALRGVPVADLMRTRLVSVDADRDVAALVHDELLAGDQSLFPVLGPDGAVVGFVGVEDVRKLPRERWATTRVGDAMTPLERVTTLPANATAEQALGALGQPGSDQVAVLDHGRVVGLLRSQDLVRWMSLLGCPGAEAAAAAA